MIRWNLVLKKKSSRPLIFTHEKNVNVTHLITTDLYSVECKPLFFIQLTASFNSFPG